MENCIFCKISKGEISSEKIFESDNFFVIPDINPVVKGHSMLISKKHYETILDLPDDLGAELLDCIKKVSLKLMKKYKVGGFNIINNNFESAGQVVKHFHMHIIPRKKGDGEIKFVKKEKGV